MSRTVYYDHSGNEIDPPKADTVKPSNADRIRSMSDEELAEFLDNHGCLWGHDIVSTADDWLGWLREEVHNE